MQDKGRPVKHDNVSINDELITKNQTYCGLAEKIKSISKGKKNVIFYPNFFVISKLEQNQNLDDIFVRFITCCMHDKIIIDTYNAKNQSSLKDIIGTMNILRTTENDIKNKVKISNIDQQTIKLDDSTLVVLQETQNVMFDNEILTFIDTSNAAELTNKSITLYNKQLENDHKYIMENKTIGIYDGQELTAYNKSTYSEGCDNLLSKCFYVLGNYKTDIISKCDQMSEFMQKYITHEICKDVSCAIDKRRTSGDVRMHIIQSNTINATKYYNYSPNQTVITCSERNKQLKAPNNALNNNDINKTYFVSNNKIYFLDNKNTVQLRIKCNDGKIYRVRFTYIKDQENNVI